MDKTINLRIAAKAVIIHDSKVLIIREASEYDEGTNGGRFQLPGGRINPEEKFIDGLLREVKEETGLLVRPIKPIFVGEWWPEIKGQENHIVGIFYLCEKISGEVKLSAEHDDYKWIEATEASQYNVMCPDCDVFEVLAKDHA